MIKIGDIFTSDGKALIMCFNLQEKKASPSKTIVLACETIYDETMASAKRVKTDYPIIWVEAALHSRPDQLKMKLQDTIDCIDNVDNILLMFGHCGNAIIGLLSQKSRLIIPRVDDCISLLLGGNKQRNTLNSDGMGYYLTRGWLQSQFSIWEDYTRCVDKYGLDRTKEIFGLMLNNYKFLNVINTGAFNLDEFLLVSKKIAGELNIGHRVVGGSLYILDMALRGDWDKDFFSLIEPGNTVELRDLRLIPG